MRVIAIIITMMCLPLVSKGDAEIESYYKRMVKELRPMFAQRDTVFMDAFKGFDDHSTLDRNRENLNQLDEIKDEYFFIFLSKSLMGRKERIVTYKDPRVWCIQTADRQIMTSQDLDSIESWWDRNHAVLSTDFLEDAVFSRMILPCMTRTRSIKSRLDVRRAGFRPDSLTDSSLLSKKDVLVDGLKSLQRTFNPYVAPLRTIIESAIPNSQGQSFVYITKGLMSGERYKSNTPVTREEFDEMKDWWFLNGKNVTDAQYYELWSELSDDILSLENVWYYDKDLPDESY